eukprot:1779508-Amphidinium_carterae.1
MGQLLWVSQLWADIAFAVKELSRPLQQPNNEALKSIKRHLIQKWNTMNKDKSKFTLSHVQTATGQAAIQQGKAQVEQSQHAG